jgi:hypothetical protein
MQLNAMALCHDQDSVSTPPKESFRTSGNDGRQIVFSSSWILWVPVACTVLCILFYSIYNISTTAGVSLAVHISKKTADR